MRVKRKAIGRSGYTLVEVVVAAAITLLLAGSLLAVVSGTLAAWNRSVGALSEANQARIVLDVITRDLQGALFCPDGKVWMAATINQAPTSYSGPFTLAQRGWQDTGTSFSGSPYPPYKPPNSAAINLGDVSRSLDSATARFSEARFGQSGMWFRFFTTKLDGNFVSVAASGGGGYYVSAPSAVSYQIVRRQVKGNSSEIRYMLYRSEVRVKADPAVEVDEDGDVVPTVWGTWEAGYDLTWPNPQIDAAYQPNPFPGTIPQNYNSASGAAGNPGTVIRPSESEVIANNVIDFGLRCYVRSGNNLNLIFPANAAAVLDPNDTELLVRVPGTFNERPPQVIDILVRVLSEEGARLIQNLEAGRLGATPPSGMTTADWWWSIAVQHSQVFVRRVEIPVGTL